MAIPKYQSRCSQRVTCGWKAACGKLLIWSTRSLISSMKTCMSISSRPRILTTAKLSRAIEVIRSRPSISATASSIRVMICSSTSCGDAPCQVIVTEAPATGTTGNISRSIWLKPSTPPMKATTINKFAATALRANQATIPDITGLLRCRWRQRVQLASLRLSRPPPHRHPHPDSLIHCD